MNSCRNMYNMCQYKNHILAFPTEMSCHPYNSVVIVKMRCQGRILWDNVDMYAIRMHADTTWTHHSNDASGQMPAAGSILILGQCANFLAEAWNKPGGCQRRQRSTHCRCAFDDWWLQSCLHSHSILQVLCPSQSTLLDNSTLPRSCWLAQPAHRRPGALCCVLCQNQMQAVTSHKLLPGGQEWYKSLLVAHRLQLELLLATVLQHKAS